MLATSSMFAFDEDDAQPRKAWRRGSVGLARFSFESSDEEDFAGVGVSVAGDSINAHANVSSNVNSKGRSSNGNNSNGNNSNGNNTKNNNNNNTIDIDFSRNEKLNNTHPRLRQTSFAVSDDNGVIASDDVPMELDEIMDPFTQTMGDRMLDVQRQRPNKRASGSDINNLQTIFSSPTLAMEREVKRHALFRGTLTINEKPFVLPERESATITTTTNTTTLPLSTVHQPVIPKARYFSEREKQLNIEVSRRLAAPSSDSEFSNDPLKRHFHAMRQTRRVCFAANGTLFFPTRKQVKRVDTCVHDANIGKVLNVFYNAAKIHRAPHGKTLPDISYDTQSVSFSALEAVATSQTERDVHGLLSALFDTVTQQISQDVTSQTQQQLIEMARRTSLSRWLANRLSSISIANAKTEYTRFSETKDDTYLFTTILALIRGRMINEATHLAMANKCYRLATMLPQLGTSDYNTQQAATQQLRDITRNVTAGNAKVAPAYLDILRILTGSTDEENLTIVTRGMPLEQVFAMMLWYFSAEACTVSTKHQSNDLTTVEDNDRHGPIKMAQDWCRLCYEGNMDEVDADPENSYFWQAITMYTNSENTFEALRRLASSATYNLFSNQQSLPWSVYHIFSHVKNEPKFEDHPTLSPVPMSVINDRSTSFSTSKPLKVSRNGAKLLVSMIETAEANDRWEYAVFLALHLPSSRRMNIEWRKVAVLPILARHCSPHYQLNEQEAFVVQQLKVPERWLWEAKAVHLRYISDARPSSLSLFRSHLAEISTFDGISIYKDANANDVLNLTPLQRLYHETCMLFKAHKNHEAYRRFLVFATQAIIAGRHQIDQISELFSKFETSQYAEGVGQLVFRYVQFEQQQNDESRLQLVDLCCELQERPAPFIKQNLLASASLRTIRHRLQLDRVSMQSRLPINPFAYEQDLIRAEYIIGRARTADISIDSPECSKKHCRIYTLEDKSAVQTVNSVCNLNQYASIDSTSNDAILPLSFVSASAVRPSLREQNASDRLASTLSSTIRPEDLQKTINTTQGAIPVLCMIEDCSTNGTFINGRKLERGKAVVLNHGDELEIKIGNFFIYSDSTQESKEKISSDEEIEVVESLYHISKTLGSGTYAEVKLAIAKATGQRYAVKIVDKRKAGIRVSNNSKQPNGKGMPAGPLALNSVAEIKIMLDIDHPNVVKIHEVVQTKKYLYIFLQLVNGGELFEYLADHLSIPEDLCKFWIYQVLKAVKYLHDRGITHRDIKPENILLDYKRPHTRVLLSDFGLAKAVNDTTLMSTMCGTFNYLAPEVVASEHTKSGYSKAVDCWSLGVMTYFLLSGTLPFEGQNDRELRREILRGHIDFTEPSHIWPHVSAEAKDIIKCFLTIDPTRRATIDQAFQHEWIAKDIDWLNELYEQVVPLQSIVRPSQEHSRETDTAGVKESGSKREDQQSRVAPSIEQQTSADNGALPITTEEMLKSTSQSNFDAQDEHHILRATDAYLNTETEACDYSRTERRRSSQQNNLGGDQVMSAAVAAEEDEVEQENSLAGEYSFLETSCDGESLSQPSKKKVKGWSI